METTQWHPSNGWRFLYVRDSRGNPVGVIACNSDGRMGWSLCKRNADNFTKRVAKMQATSPERLRPIPEASPKDASNTPMNRTLFALSQDMTVPHTIRRGARQALEMRCDVLPGARVVAEPLANESLLGRIANWFFGE